MSAENPEQTETDTTQDVANAQGADVMPDMQAEQSNKKVISAAEKAAIALARKEALKKARQISIDEMGAVFYQADPTNPTPGIEVGVLSKGADWLTPNLNLNAGGIIDPGFLNQSLLFSIDTVLFVLKSIAAKSDGECAVSKICKILYEHGGMIKRSQIDVQILSDLTPEMRSELRSLGIRMGPLYVSCPEMNKPEALKMRGLLWALYNGLEMPVPTITEGAVSFKLDEEKLTRSDFYSVMGYPVYAGRAIRVDMLERVISAAYDSADKGRFRAQHKMAEWLGVSIDDLYRVLEGLGHKKIEDAPAAAPTSGEDQPSDDKIEPADAGVSAAKDDSAEGQLSSEASTEEEAVKDQGSTVAQGTLVKPELALFQLKPGANKHKGGRDHKLFKKSAHKKDAKAKGGKRNDYKQKGSHKKPKRPSDDGGSPYHSQKDVLKHSPFAAALSGLSSDD